VIKINAGHFVNRSRCIWESDARADSRQLQLEQKALLCLLCRLLSRTRCPLSNVRLPLVCDNFRILCLPRVQLDTSAIVPC
jgi:hypothetical protein